MSDSIEIQTETLLFYQEMAKTSIQLMERWKTDKTRICEIDGLVDELLDYTKKVWDIEHDPGWEMEQKELSPRGEILHQTVLMKKRALHEASLTSNDPRIKQYYCIVCQNFSLLP
ncbi:Oidioi.mRNA.OKI2018_I69.XSR.g16985.t1.cds [Oikopleura dioica]|uniref:Oidioi.mRNA.OKI2018_I69.XSR.g16985.t1.cds n=1 Tax=Oikopleura dioica TaxID=34765 RepID=A0ABN7SMH7_OIKDI|nr:Oidioi.mRNA.OKI2018_I69.XSR.g16985.t1.cds [Oikopleura dioica]